MGFKYSPSILTNGLVFCFDAANLKSYAGSGTTVNNLINSAAGEAVGPTFSTNNNGYFSFVTNDYIRFSEDSALNAQTITVEVWARTNATNQNGFWFEKGNVNTQYSLFQEGGAIRWRANFGAGLVNMVSPTTATYINTTDWFQIAATFVSGQQFVYINGDSVGQGNSTGTLATNANGVSIGAYGGFNGSRSYFYNGDISVVRVYNRVLSQTEVKQNFSALRGRYGI